MLLYLGSWFYKFLGSLWEFKVESYRGAAFIPSSNGWTWGPSSLDRLLITTELSVLNKGECLPLEEPVLKLPVNLALASCLIDDKNIGSCHLNGLGKLIKHFLQNKNYCEFIHWIQSRCKKFSSLWNIQLCLIIKFAQICRMLLNFVGQVWSV